jgi:hypothetical protein
MADSPFSGVRGQGSAEACFCTFFNCVATERNYLQKILRARFYLTAAQLGKAEYPSGVEGTEFGFIVSNISEATSR